MEIPMRLAVLALLSALLASPAWATPEYILPTLFDVAGVAANDVLNIRERPDAKAPIIGKLAPNARGIEVVAERSGWMQVNTAERPGWVNGRYLNYRVDVWEEGRLPAGLACLGTEPFWSLAAAKGNVTLSRPEGGQTTALRKVLSTGWFRDPRRAVVADGLTAVITPAACSDGMSDRAYGLEATVILGHGAQAQMLNGCCSIAR